MEKRYFKIHDLCYGLDGLIAEVSGIPSIVETFSMPSVVNVERLINSNIIVGDRQFILPIGKNGLMIRSTYLTEVEDPGVSREFGSDNPYGECRSESTIGFDCVTVNIANFQNAMLVTIRDKSVAPIKTLFSEYFTGNEIKLCEDILEGHKDLEDLVFLFKSIVTDRGKK